MTSTSFVFTELANTMKYGGGFLYLVFTEWRHCVSQNEIAYGGGGVILVPVAKTGFSHRLTAYKIVGHFFGLSYRKISGHINQVKYSFFRISNISVPCPHAQLRGARGRTVIKKLWTFLGPWGRDRSQSPPCWIFQVKHIHQSTASERTTRLVLFRVWSWLVDKSWDISCHFKEMSRHNDGPASAMSAHNQTNAV